MRPLRLSQTVAAVFTAAGCLLVLPGSAAAQTGSVSGRVTTVQSGAPVLAAQVFIVDTQLGTLTNSEGEYRISGVSPGERQVRVLVMGYRSETVTVSVAAGETATADFQLLVAAVPLDEILVTGTAGRQERRAQAASVASVQAAALNEVAPANNLATLLRAQAPGVSISMSSGTSGSTQRIRLRGVASLNLSNEPLLIVDGVRTDARTYVLYSVGGQAPSRFNDINPDDIESIEIVKGPAAATLYGADASAGVIQIRTKRGQIGAGFRQTVSYEMGVLQPAWTPPDNWGTCTAAQVADRTRTLCYGQPVGTLVSDNPLLRYDVLGNGDTWNLAWSGRGGGPEYGYYLSFSAEEEQGVLPDNKYARYTGRVNFDFTPREDLRLDWSMGLGRIHSYLPQNDDNTVGYFGGALFGNPVTVGTANDGWYGANRQREAISSVETKDRTLRVTPVLTVNYAPLPWFRHRLSVGVDMTRTEQRRFWPKNDKGWYTSATLNSGDVAHARQNRDEITLDYLGTVRRYLPNELTADVAFGLQAVARRSDLTYAEGQGLTTNSANSINAAAQTLGGQSYFEQREGGVLAQLDLAWRERLFLQLGGRLDRNSSFGEDAGAFFNPKAGLSWVLSEEGFYPETARRIASTLRLRAVWGATGRSPQREALATYSAAPYAATPTTAGSGVIPNNPGNRNLRPERGEEVELGLDAGLFHERVGLEVTYYDKTSKDLILARPIAPSLGYAASPNTNIGEMQNSGWEVGVDAKVLRGPTVAWDARVNLTTHRNEIVSLQGVDFASGSVWRVIAGYPAYGWWTRMFRSLDVANNRAV
ncbi:MAG: SusC/RagA family TonB-linked outer membrane protein, partial [Gemmatimonadetes bacterium]|nr:SusC/RagA family TonB-linked outer membrane protein [Gemmatimonadota bacterium]